MKHFFIPALLVGTLVCLSSCTTRDRAQTADGQAYGQNDHAAAGPGGGQMDDAWPMKFYDGSTGYTVYEPQSDSWDGHQLMARSVVAVQPAGQSQPTYGVFSFNAITLVDKSSRTVTLANFKLTSADFPSARAQTQGYLVPLLQNFPAHAPALALDRLENSLAVSEPPRSDRLNNTPPKIIVVTRPAILVAIDGPPAWRTVPDTGLQRVINTRMLLLKDPANRYYLHLFDGYLQAPSLPGPWTVASQPPAGAVSAEKQVTDSGLADLMRGTADPVTQKDPSLSTSPLPDVFVSSVPAELVELHGPAEFASIPGTDLLYAVNTSGNLFKSLADQQNYILISGRWYRAASLDGPWQFVPGNRLPSDFANIPDSSPKENVKASVPGTPQAEEALIANSIPQSTAVARGNVLPPPQFDGAMQLSPIAGTPLHYVLNSPTPIIEVNPQSWYACQDGVWYTASSASGPWTVAAWVPPVIYTIPSGSPLHYVTYVQVYGASPNTVYEGYTPGYMGTEVADDGTVVYGTGYDYDPWIGSVWYGPPVTWGWGFDDCWTPWWGWGFGCGFGWGWGFGWAGCFPPYPWWGGFWHWHDHDRNGWRHDEHGGWGNTTADVYRHHGAGTFAQHGNPGGAGQAYNSRTGWLQAGQHARMLNVPGGAWDMSRAASLSQNGGHPFGFNNPPTSAGGRYVYNRSFNAPGFGGMNRGFPSYGRAGWYGGYGWSAAPPSRGWFQSRGNVMPQEAPHASVEGSFHGGGGGGSFRGGGGGGGGFHGGGGGGRGR